MPEVSVILPTFNRSHISTRSIRSVLSQTYQDFELIIVDDGCTDGTEKLVRSLSSEKIRYIKHQRNKGISAARNTGIRLARGDFIAFQDDDDEWYPEKLEKQIKAYTTASSELGVVYTHRNFIYRKYEYIPPSSLANKEGYIFNQLLKLNFIGPQTSLIRKECFNNVGMFDESFFRMGDVELFLRISQYYQFKYINEPLVKIYRERPLSRTETEQTINSLKRILEIYSPQIKKERKVLAKYYYWIADQYCTLDKLSQGRYYLLKSIKTNPTNLIVIGAFGVSLLGSKIYNIISWIYRNRRILFHRFRKAYFTQSLLSLIVLYSL